MNQAIFQVFFDVIEVIGVGIIDGQTQIDFYLKNQEKIIKEKQEITQSILKIVTDKYEGFDYLEFPIMDYYAHIYKLNHNFHIIILTCLLSTKQFQDVLHKDIEIAFIEFNNLIENVPQFTEIKVTVEDLLIAANQLSQFISKYMGTKLTANYWELTRPQFEWLNNFQINHSAKITFSTINKKPISALQHQWVKQWTAAFIKRCAQTIKDLPALIEDKCLDENQKKILLSYSAISMPGLESDIVIHLPKS